MVAEAAEAAKKARVLLITGICAGLFTLASYFVPQLESPPIHEWLGWGFLATAAEWSFTIYLGPALFGAGFLIGPRVALSLLLGAVLAWGVIRSGREGCGLGGRPDHELRIRGRAGGFSGPGWR